MVVKLHDFAGGKQMQCASQPDMGKKNGSLMVWRSVVKCGMFAHALQELETTWNGLTQHIYMIDRTVTRSSTWENQCDYAKGLWSEGLRCGLQANRFAP